MNRKELVRNLEQLSEKVQNRDAINRRIDEIETEKQRARENVSGAQVAKKPINQAEEYYKKRILMEKENAESSFFKYMILLYVIAGVILAIGFAVMYFLLDGDFSGQSGNLVFAFLWVPILVASVTWIIQVGAGFISVIFAVGGVFFGLGSLIMLPTYIGIEAIVFSVAMAVAAFIVFFALNLFKVEHVSDPSIGEKIKSSAEYQRLIELDRKNAQDNHRKFNLEKERIQVIVEKELEGLDAKRQELVAEGLRIDRELRDNELLPYDDLHQVGSVLNFIKQMRADSIKEALHMCDEADRRIQREIREANMQMWKEKQQAWRDLENQWKQDRHNSEIERQQRRQTEEMERIRKALEQ